MYATYEVNARLSDLKIHAIIDKLNPNEEEIKAEETAKEVKKESRTRSANFTFSEWEIPVGAVLEYYTDSTIICTVVDDIRVEYNGEIMSLTKTIYDALGAQRKAASKISKSRSGILSTDGEMARLNEMSV